MAVFLKVDRLSVSFRLNNLSGGRKIKKSLAGNKLANRIVASFLTLYIRFCHTTTRWHKEGVEELSQVVASGQPAILVMWHERLLMSPYMFDTKSGAVTAILTKSRMAYLGTVMLTDFDFDSLIIPPKALGPYTAPAGP